MRTFHSLQLPVENRRYTERRTPTMLSLRHWQPMLIFANAVIYTSIGPPPSKLSISCTVLSLLGPGVIIAFHHYIRSPAPLYHGDSASSNLCFQDASRC